MSVQQPSTENKKHSVALDTRLQGRWLLLARSLWGILVVSTLVIVLLSLPVYLTQLQTPCVGSECAYQQLSPQQVELLKGLRLSPDNYATYMIALMLATMGVCLVVSTLIVWRRSHDRMALLVAFMLVTFGPIFVTSTVPDGSPLQIPNACLNFLAFSLFVFVFLLFPTGQFVPRWTSWTAVGSLAVQVPATFFPNSDFTLNTLVGTLSYPVLIAETAILAVVQLYRYRWVSSPLQRQQTKWVVFGIALPATVYVVGTVLSLIFPALDDSSSLYGAPYQLALTVSTFLLLFVPLSFGFAMLRYRLWDVDVLINRTLVYGSLTAILTGVYVGLIIGLQALLDGIISQDNSVAIVVSTLVIVALSQPLRKRLQTLIDRRFYRRKYDAAKTLAAFSATLRNEVDVSHLSEQLIAVIEETMQPASISLWLCQSHPNALRGEPTHTDLDSLQATHTIEPSRLVKEEPHE